MELPEGRDPGRLGELPDEELEPDELELREPELDELELGVLGEPEG